MDPLLLDLRGRRVCFVMEFSRSGEARCDLLVAVVDLDEPELDFLWGRRDFREEIEAGECSMDGGGDA